MRATTSISNLLFWFLCLNFVLWLFYEYICNSRLAQRDFMVFYWLWWINMEAEIAYKIETRPSGKREIGRGWPVFAPFYYSPVSHRTFSIIKKLFFLLYLNNCESNCGANSDDVDDDDNANDNDEEFANKGRIHEFFFICWEQKYRRAAQPRIKTEPIILVLSTAQRRNNINVPRINAKLKKFLFGGTRKSPSHQT